MPPLPPLRYTRPPDLAAAIAAVARPGACIYAGGTDVLVALAERRPWARFVSDIVDIKHLPEAAGIAAADDSLRIGALVTAEALAADRRVRRYARALAEAAAQTSAPALRSRGTVGGNVSTPHPAGDVTTALLALGGTAEVATADGTRRMPLAQFIGAQADAWPRQQLLLAVHVARCRRSAFEKLGTRAAFSRSVVAVAAAMDGDRLRVALGGVAERPFLSARVPFALDTDEALAAALSAECRPPGDGLATDGFRLRAAATLVRRAIARMLS